MKYLIILILFSSCSKTAIEAISDPTLINRGYIEYNGYIQDLGCSHIDDVAYNSFNSDTNTLTLHNDSIHLEISNTFNLKEGKGVMSGEFTTPKGKGTFLYVPIN